MSRQIVLSRSCILVLIVLLAVNRQLSAQSGPSDSAQPRNSSLEDAVVELQKEIRDLQSAVQEIHAEAMQYRAETLALKQELEATRQPLATRPASAESTAGRESTSSRTVDERLGRVEEDQELLSGKINDQYQTKVESASKYRVRLSGIVLFNLFGNRGTVDNIDIPNLALPRSKLDSAGSLGATLRQSEVGLEVFGPRLAGAQSRADLQFDFSGGFPNNLNGVTEGIVRLRTGTLRLDWNNTSVVAGQDALFFSPLSPTSFASLSIPALSYAGNLWTWTPQFRVERRERISPTSSILLQGGILDALSGEPPASEYLRQPQAGERSRQPGYGTRLAWSYDRSANSLTVGLGGYFSRQDWGFGRKVDAWAATSDWNLPLTHWLSVSGEFYRGGAVGGLGGGIGRSVLVDGALSNPNTTVQGLNSLGGWSQAKFKLPDGKVEFNVAFGQENPWAGDLRRFSSSGADAVPARNRSYFFNVIYRPRSDMIFSVEYRHLHTFVIQREDRSADQLNTALGFTF